MTIRFGEHEVLVSDEDAPLLEARGWMVNLSSDGRPYLRATGGKREYFHRVVCPEGDVTDHRNGNTLDNRRENLRPASLCENAHNCKVRSDSSTGIRGVRKSGKRYVARIAAGFKRVHLGSFPTIEEAAAAYEKAAAELHGEFSHTRRST